MRPRRSRTWPLPPQWGHGRGLKAISPAPPHPAQGSKRISWTRRAGAVERLLEGDLRHLLEVLARQPPPAAADGGRRTPSKNSRKSRRPVRTSAEKSKPWKPTSGGGRDRLRLLAAVVLAAALRVVQHLERDRDRPEALGRHGVARVQVRVELTGELLVGAPDLGAEALRRTPRSS